MNSPGNKLVDDFDAPELAPMRQAFLDGAHFIYGHTVMQRTLGLGYQSAWAQAQSADPPGSATISTRKLASLCRPARKARRCCASWTRSPRRLRCWRS